MEADGSCRANFKFLKVEVARCALCVIIRFYSSVQVPDGIKSQVNRVTKRCEPHETARLADRVYIYAG